MIFWNENENMGRAGGKLFTEPKSSAESDPARQFRANVNLGKFVSEFKRRTWFKDEQKKNERYRKLGKKLETQSFSIKIFLNFLDQLLIIDYDSLQCSSLDHVLW